LGKSSRTLRTNPRPTDRYGSVSSTSSTTSKTKTKKAAKSNSLPTNSKSTQSKKSNGNAFASGRNGQNSDGHYNNNRSKKKSATVSNAIDDVSSNKSDDDEWEDVDNNDDDKKKQSSTQSLNNNNKRSQRYAPCWTYFSVARGKHPITKEACDMCYCKIKVDGNKECGVSFVKHNNTTHLNDHLFNEHKKEEFRPKRMMGPGDVQDINVLLAKFIISSNSAFRICENKYLKV
jgi:hypothetical protein